MAVAPVPASGGAPEVRGRARRWSGRVRTFLFVPAIAAVIALLFVNIVDRFVLDGALGISWVEELSVIVMIWLVFLSVFALDQDNSHIKVQILDLPAGLQEGLEDLAMVLFVGFLVWSTWALLPRMFSKYAALGWPIQVGYYALLVGGSVAILAKVGKYVLRGLRR